MLKSGSGDYLLKDRLLNELQLNLRFGEAALVAGGGGMDLRLRVGRACRAP